MKFARLIGLSSLLPIETDGIRRNDAFKQPADGCIGVQQNIFLVAEQNLLLQS